MEAPTHYHLALQETPETTRFLLSNGVTIDIESFATHSGMRKMVVDWAKKEFGDKDIRIDGSTVLVAGVEHAVVSLSAWEPVGVPEPPKSSVTSTKRSTPTKGKKLRVRRTTK